ncbi:MAG: type II toxin-antitoxin system RelE/ParE family toxin [Nostoc sp.]|uniref:type II toxin-antitoxin system RelE/ParE family toxin n=1 Tax=Nostoc sp. TaxID=1180 RepID=UPI002FEF09AB
MAFTVKLSALATQHIEDAYSWIQETNPGALDEWFNGITNALQSLKNLPYRCSRIPETGELNQEIRQLIYFPRRRVVFLSCCLPWMSIS